MALLRNDVHNLSNYTRVWNKIYQEFYHGIVYIANEGCHIRISVITLSKFFPQTMFDGLFWKF